MPGSKASKTAVHFFMEDGFMVRGAPDVHEAYRLALDECEEPNGMRIGYEAYEAHQAQDGEDDGWPDSAKGIADLADEVWTKIQGARVCRGRIVPCGPEDVEGYVWRFWGLADDAKGPGIFTAVVFP